MKTILVEGPLKDYISYIKNNKGIVSALLATARYTPAVIAKYIGFKKSYVNEISKNIEKLAQIAKENPNDERFAESFSKTLVDTFKVLEKNCPKNDLECNKLIQKLKNIDLEIKKVMPKITTSLNAKSSSFPVFASAFSVAAGVALSNVISSFSTSTEDYPEGSEISSSVTLNIFKILNNNFSLMNSDISVTKKILIIIATLLIISGISVLAYKLLILISNKLKGI